MTAADDVNLDDLKRRARRRLVGAIVLALVVAVVVPMLLESDPKPLGEDVSVKIPPVDDGKFVNRLSDRGKGDATRAESAKPSTKAAVKGEGKTEATKVAVDSAAPAADAGKGEPAASKTETGSAAASVAGGKSTGASDADAGRASVETAKPEPAAAAPEVAAASGNAAPPGGSSAATKAAAGNDGPGIPPAAPDGLYAVQVYAFSDVYGANSLVNKLKRVGYPAYSEPTTTSKGKLWRVRIGPYASREVAATARDKLKGEGYNGIVTTR
ncbi:MAG: SPOR domain-containing protein [Burkholderiales bacterium]|nr:SPOR domain-containing protein [Burkholderiales bacterium]